MATQVKKELYSGRLADCNITCNKRVPTVGQKSNYNHVKAIYNTLLVKFMFGKLIQQPHQHTIELSVSNKCMSKLLMWLNA